jgi:hypothetical protein
VPVLDAELVSASIFMIRRAKKKHLEANSPFRLLPVRYSNATRPSSAAGAGMGVGRTERGNFVDQARLQSNKTDTTGRNDVSPALLRGVRPPAEDEWPSHAPPAADDRC